MAYFLRNNDPIFASTTPRKPAGPPNSLATSAALDHSERGLAPPILSGSNVGFRLGGGGAGGGVGGASLLLFGIVSSSCQCLLLGELAWFLGEGNWISNTRTVYVGAATLGSLPEEVQDERQSTSRTPKLTLLLVEVIQATTAAAPAWTLRTYRRCRRAHSGPRS